MLLANAHEEEKLDLRVKRTRNLILRAFSELLAEKGFEAITVQDITQRAEVNRATFYAHFPDKYALLQYTIRHAFEEELKQRTLSACHYSAENLRALISTVCDFVAHSERHCKSSDGQFHALVEGQVREQVQRLLRFWLEQKNIPQEEGSIASAAVTWAIYGLAQHWAHSKPQPPLDAYVEQIISPIQELLKGWIS